MSESKMSGRMEGIGYHPHSMARSAGTAEIEAVDDRALGEEAEQVADASPRIGILVVAYNAESTLASVLDRVPESFRDRISEIFVCDDHSADSTYLVGLGYKEQNSDMPLQIIRHPENLGYGGNQKAGYRMAIDAGLDIIVMLHGDGQYAPECLPEIVAPLERNEADCVMGSRMMVPGDARKGGMPLYKYVGNRILTNFENGVLGTDLTEFHSGYRAYRVDALASIPFERNSDDFHFDTQIIIQLVDAGKRLMEIPIPTFYGDEICYVNGFGYARDVSIDVVRYRLGKLGFISGEYGGVDDFAPRQEDAAHATILRWLEHRPHSRVLTCETSGSELTDKIRRFGHDVTTVNTAELARQPAETVLRGGPYDVVLLSDALERVLEPGDVLAQARRVLAEDGQMIVSVPNFGHWYVRLRTLLGLFDYDQRGLLDKSHVRFFTRAGLHHRLRMAGFDVVREEATGLPLDVLAGRKGAQRRLLGLLDRLSVAMRPTLFGYQLICTCERSRSFDAATPV
jgi:glycosyltransferase involved in cell wall biosynthesis